VSAAEWIVLLLLLCSSGASAIAGTASILDKRRLGALCFWLGWGANGALFAVNAWVAQAPPFGSLYHVLVVLALCGLPVSLLLARRFSLDWIAGYFALSSAVPLIGALCVGRNMQWRQVPALQSPWFVPHVFAYMLAYSLAAVAFVLMLARWCGRSAVRRGGVLAHEQAAHQVIRLAFPLMTFGMLSGALWADEVWGVYWSWDPKETWSLITWSLYLVYLHCKSSPSLARYSDLAHLAGFAALVTTFLLVNVVPKLASALHSY